MITEQGLELKVAYVAGDELYEPVKEEIVICGRVSDASLVVGAAWYWHSWSDTDYDRLAQCLIAGHLIECSAYVTGANYAAFYEEKMESLIDLGFPIVEVAINGTLIVCKHEKTNGLVTVDIVKC
jgi:hypothetical protein